MSSRGSASDMGVGRAGGFVGSTARLARLSTESSELLAAVDRLPALAGDPQVDLDQATAADLGFSFVSALRPFRRALLWCAALVVVDAGTSLIAPILIRHGIDDAVIGGSRRTLLVVCLLFLAVQIVSWINATRLSFQTLRTAERILFSLRARTFAHLQRLSLDYYDQQMAGKIMTRMTSDIEAFAQLVQQGLLTALVSFLTCCGVAVALIVLSPTLAAAMAIVVVPLFVATAWFRRSSGRTYSVARQRVSALYADMQESLSGARVSQAFSQQAANEARFAELADAYNASRRRSVELIARFFPFIQLMSSFAKVLALVIGARQVASGNLTPGVLIAFLIYVDQFFTPIQQLSSVFDQWLQASVAVTQLTELLRTPTNTPAAEHPIEPGRLRGEIRLERAQLAYASTGLVAMRDVDLEIPAGQVVALVGTTGAGKSTLVKLVARFYDPTAGRVLIDGMSLTEIDLAAYRHQLGYVPQEPFLFSGTVRTNIAYGKRDASDLEVERAARAVGAHPFIAALPHGYHTPVTEEGRSLSAGQRQLLSLARAHLVDPAIMLLDEATANLDLATERRVLHALGLVAQGRTTIIIAHRLQTARLAERILIIDEGRVVEDGSHDDLIELGGQYASLWSFATATAPT